MCRAARAMRAWAGILTSVLLFAVSGCQSSVPSRASARKLAAYHDEIIVAGRRFPTGTRVVTWLDPDGYNAYAGAAPTTLRAGLKGVPARREFAALQAGIDQFVLHYDGSGLSRLCFATLQERKLSVHFLLDVDGTIYQTLDLRERAAHATIANDRSIGIEMANLGAYPETARNGRCSTNGTGVMRAEEPS